MKILLTILASTPLVIVHSLIEGFVLKHLWSWFIVTTFPAIPHLTIVQALGLSLVIAQIVHRPTPPVTTDEEKKQFAKNVLAHIFITPWIMLGAGYVISRFL